MLTEIMQKRSVQKLKDLLKDRYGLGLQLTSMISIADMDVRHMNSELRGRSLHVPVCARGKYLATAILVLDRNRTQELTESDISAVTEMVRLVLEPALFSLYIQRQEMNTQVELSGNVYSLPSINMTDMDDAPKPPAQFNASLVLLQSYNPHTISRIAVHIHEAANRWALLRFNEIREYLKDVQEIRSLGPLTLLIEDILLLSPDEQRQIADFAKDSNSFTEPLILIGCTSPFNELIERQIIIPELSEILLKSRLELDRMPKDFSKLRETVEIAMDRHSMIDHTLT